MQYSTNYNLNLVEGTDIVNPLVIDKPNYVTIDAQMKANEDAGVGTATEIKTGSVHALTRANGDNNTFRFVATSIYNQGDTFTVDGISVTALLPSGETLGNNAYVIGSNVLCILTSTELTVFTVGGTASNASMLNSQLPSYYLDARNEGFDNTGTDLSATNTEGAIKEICTRVVNLETVHEYSVTGIDITKEGNIVTFDSAFATFSTLNGFNVTSAYIPNVSKRGVGIAYNSLYQYKSMVEITIDTSGLVTVKELSATASTDDYIVANLAYTTL